MNNLDLRPAELAFIIGVPAAWGILLLFHPLGDGGFYEVIDGNVTAWLTVHLGMGIFVPLFAGVIYLLLRGVKSTAATVSRIGLAIFAILYAAWELVLGVGTGILAQEVNALPVSEQAAGADLIQPYAENGVIVVLSVLGSIGLGVAMIGAAVALRRTYGLGWASLVLMVLAMPLIAIHEPPFGPVGWPSSSGRSCCSCASRQLRRHGVPRLSITRLPPGPRRPRLRTRRTRARSRAPPGRRPARTGPFTRRRRGCGGSRGRDPRRPRPRPSSVLVLDTSAALVALTAGDPAPGLVERLARVELFASAQR